MRNALLIPVSAILMSCAGGDSPASTAFVPSDVPFNGEAFARLRHREVQLLFQSTAPRSETEVRRNCISAVASEKFIETNRIGHDFSRVRLTAYFSDYFQMAAPDPVGMTVSPLRTYCQRRVVASIQG